MTSFEMEILVKDRIAERLHEADMLRLAKIAGQHSRDTTVRPPRGPLFAGLGRVVARFSGAG